MTPLDIRIPAPATLVVHDQRTGSSYTAGGMRIRVRFDNGYGASIIRNRMSYGHEDDLFELAVLHDDDITYDTPITDDVIGNLTSDEVTYLLAKIVDL